MGEESGLLEELVGLAKEGKHEKVSETLLKVAEAEEGTEEPEVEEKTLPHPKAPCHSARYLEWRNEPEPAWYCPICNLKYHVENGEPIGPMMPLEDKREQSQGQKGGGRGGSAGGLSDEEKKKFLEYMKSTGQIQQFQDVSPKVKQSMVEGWIEMGKPEG